MTEPPSKGLQGQAAPFQPAEQVSPRPYGRETLLLYDVDVSATEDDVIGLFTSTPELKVVSVKPDVHQTWYVKLETEDQAKKAAMHFINHPTTLNGVQVRMRVKQRGGSMPSSSVPFNQQVKGGERPSDARRKKPVRGNEGPNHNNRNARAKGRKPTTPPQPKEPQLKELQPNDFPQLPGTVNPQHLATSSPPEDTPGVTGRSWAKVVITPVDKPNSPATPSGNAPQKMFESKKGTAKSHAAYKEMMTTVDTTSASSSTTSASTPPPPIAPAEHKRRGWEQPELTKKPDTTPPASNTASVKVEEDDQAHMNGHAKHESDSVPAPAAVIPENKSSQGGAWAKSFVQVIKEQPPRKNNALSISSALKGNESWGDVDDEEQESSWPRGADNSDWRKDASQRRVAEIARGGRGGGFAQTN